MTAFKSPEIAGFFGAIDSVALNDGRVMPAHVLRELIRSANLLMAKGSLMFRWVGSSRENPTEVDSGSGRHYMSPFWRPLIPIEDWPVPKKPGLTEAHLRVQARISNLGEIEVQIATRGNGGFEFEPDASKTFTMVGDGTPQAYGSGVTIQCRPGKDEVIGIYARARTDSFNDVDLATGTFGGAASGVVTSDTVGIFWDTALGAPWNLPPYTTINPSVHEGGHYVFFTQLVAGIDQIVHGPALITNTWRETPRSGEGLHFYPPADSLFFPSLSTTTYRIKQLPLIQMQGVAIYSKNREA